MPPDSAAVPPRRRWLRLSLRGLMILVVVVAVPVGWMARTVRTQREAIAVVRAAGAFGYETVEWPWLAAELTWQARAWRAVWGWFEGAFGDEIGTDYRTIEFEGPVNDETLGQLAWFDSLENLRCDATGPVRAGWRHLIALRQLRSLNLSGSGVDDAALAVIGRLGTLESLTLAEVPATDAGLAALVRLRKLDDLTVARCPNLTDAGLARLVAGLPPLHWLTIHGGPTPLSATLTALVRHQPSLYALDLTGVALTDADLARVGRLTSLVNLNLDRTSATDVGLAHLGKLPLTWLDLSGTSVTDPGMATVGQLADLEALFLADLPGLTDAGLASLAGLTRLRSLHLRRTQVTAAGVAALKLVRPFVQVDR